MHLLSFKQLSPCLQLVCRDHPLFSFPLPPLVLCIGASQLDWHTGNLACDAAHPMAFSGLFPYHFSQVTGFGVLGQWNHWNVLGIWTGVWGVPLLLHLGQPCGGTSDNKVLFPDGVGLSPVIIWPCWVIRDHVQVLILVWLHLLWGCLGPFRPGKAGCWFSLGCHLGLEPRWFYLHLGDRLVSCHCVVPVRFFSVTFTSVPSGGAH